MKKKSGKNLGGRPSEYKAVYAKLVYHLCLLGATDAEIARQFEVSTVTLDSWKRKHPKFLGALKSGRDEADAKVVARLYDRAMGYSHPDTDIRTVSIGDGCSKIVQTPIIKHYPPDVTACIFWLKNRQREKWRDVNRVEHANNDGTPLMEPLAVSIAQILAQKLDATTNAK